MEEEQQMALYHVEDTQRLVDDLIGLTREKLNTLQELRRVLVKLHEDIGNVDMTDDRGVRAIIERVTAARRLVKDGRDDD